MAQKATPTVKVLKFLRAHLAKFPEEGAAIMVAVQSGEYKVKFEEVTDIMPDFKKLDRLPDEQKQAMLEEWWPSLTAEVVAKMKRAANVALGKKNDKLISKVFCVAVLEDPASLLATRSRSLIVSLYNHKRTLMPVPPTLVLKPNFTVDWDAMVVFELKGSKKVDDRDVFTTLRHKTYDVEVDLPSAVVCFHGEAFIQDGWMESDAVITTKTRDFQKNCLSLFQATPVVVDGMTKTIVKTTPWKDNIAHKAKEAKGTADAASTAADPPSVSGAAASSSPSAAPAKAKAMSTPTKRMPKRSLSEVSVPEELKATRSKK
jgi:hypothetical protein